MRDSSSHGGDIILIMEAVCISETSFYFNDTIPEGCNFHRQTLLPSYERQVAQLNSATKKYVEKGSGNSRTEIKGKLKKLQVTGTYVGR
jgi:hypothetical protein